MDGLDFDALRHTNTVKAHQLLHYAKAHPLQLEAKERLPRAYFSEGRHIGRGDELADLAADVRSSERSWPTAVLDVGITC